MASAAGQGPADEEICFFEHGNGVVEMEAAAFKDLQSVFDLGFGQLQVNPLVFSRINPTSRINWGFSKFTDSAGRKSATKRGWLSGNVAINLGSIVKLSYKKHYERIYVFGGKLLIKTSVNFFLSAR